MGCASSRAQAAPEAQQQAAERAQRQQQRADVLMQRLAHSRHRRRLTEEFLEDVEGASLPESRRSSAAQLRRGSETSSQGAAQLAQLHRAAGEGNVASLAALLRRGIPLDTADDRGW